MGGQDKRIPGCSHTSYLGKHGSKQRDPASDESEGEDLRLRLSPDFHMCASHTWHLHTTTYTCIHIIHIHTEIKKSKPKDYEGSCARAKIKRMKTPALLGTATLGTSDKRVQPNEFLLESQSSRGQLLCLLTTVFQCLGLQLLLSRSMTSAKVWLLGDCLPPRLMCWAFTPQGSGWRV